MSGELPRAQTRVAGQAGVYFVIPTLGKRMDWLQLCVRSVLGQDVPVNVVCVSPRNKDVMGLCNEIGVLHLIDEGPGLSNALNTGLREAPQGAEFFAWLGDD